MRDVQLKIKPRCSHRLPQRTGSVSENFCTIVHASTNSCYMGSHTRQRLRRWQQTASKLLHTGARDDERTALQYSQEIRLHTQVCSCKLMVTKQIPTQELVYMSNGPRKKRRTTKESMDRVQLQINLHHISGDCTSVSIF